MSIKQISSTVFIARSVFLHGAAFVAMTTAPSLVSAPEGTTQTTQIEFVSQATPMGGQVQSMDVAPLAPPTPAPKAQAPKVAETVVIPKVVPVEPPTPAPATIIEEPTPVAYDDAPEEEVTSDEGVEIQDMNGTVATRIQEEENQKFREQLEQMQQEIREARLAQVERQKQQQLKKEQEQREQRESLAAAIVSEREIQKVAQEERDLAQQEALKEALALQKSELEAKNALLANQLEEQKAGQAVALAKASETIAGQGKVIKNLEANNNNLNSKNQGMARKIKENLAYGLPSGTRDVSFLRQAQGNVPPQYPYRDRLARRQGKLLLHYYVTPQGKVSNVRVIKSSGYATLDREAQRALRSYLFQPGQQGSTKHWVNYSLIGKAQSLTGGLKTR